MTIRFRDSRSSGLIFEFRVRSLVGAVAVVVTALSISLRGEDLDYIKKIAAYAKSRGEKARTVEVIGGGGFPLDFYAALARDSVYLVTATGRNTVLNLGMTLVTWHWLQVDDALVVRPNRPEFCQTEFRGGPAVGPNEIGVITEGGTATVDDVAVTIFDRYWQDWKPMKSQRYLLLAQRCPLGSIRLIYGRDSLIPVAPDGALTASPEQVNLLGGIRTIEALRKRLAVTK